MKLNPLSLATAAAVHGMSVAARSQQPRIITSSTEPEPAPVPEQPAPIGAEPLNLMQRYHHNSRGRDFVVGGLHGCFSMLMAMLRQLNFDTTKDRLFCTGNLGSHGPEAEACYDLMDEPWFHAVAGSFESQLLNAVSKPDFDWERMRAAGGKWAAELDHDRLVELAAEVAELPLAIVVGDERTRFNVIHAEFNGPDEALEDALENITTAHPVPRSVTFGSDVIRGKADVSEQEGLSLTFAGHTIVEQMGKVGSHVFIDTGAFLAQASGDHSRHAMTIIEPKTARIWRSMPIPAQAA